MVASKSCVRSDRTIRSNKTGEEDIAVIVIKVRFKCDICGISFHPVRRIIFNMQSFRGQVPWGRWRWNPLNAHVEKEITYW